LIVLFEAVKAQLEATVMIVMMPALECHLVTVNSEVHCEHVTIIDQEDHLRLRVEAIEVERIMDPRVDMTTMMAESAAGAGHDLHTVGERMEDTGRGA
jgi:hypothetical protein